MLMQDLTIYLKSGEKLSLVFEAEKADELHPQIEAFFKALNYWKNSIGSFRFARHRLDASGMKKFIEYVKINGV